MSDFETPDVVKEAYMEAARESESEDPFVWENLLREALLEVV